MADEWGAPQSSDTPAAPSGGVDALLTKLEQVKRELRDLPHGLLKQAGISVVPGGIVLGGDVEVSGDMDVSGNADFSGTVDVTGAMTVGGALEVTGDAVFSGDLAVPNGSITNAALASPVTAASGSANTGSGSAVAVGTSAGTFATVSIAVPAGFSRAFVTGISSLASANAVAVYIATRIQGSDGLTMPIVSAPNGAATGAVSYARELTGLAGGTITVSTRAFGSSALTAYMVTSASVLFLK